MNLPRALPSLPVPTELSVQIFQSLHSIYDVISLAAASRTLRHIWLEHAAPIYHQVPKYIDGEIHARKLQLAMSGNKDVTADDIVSIMRRARFVGIIISEFEQKIASKVSAWYLRHFYKKVQRPQHLTATERRRFIRTYYQLWMFIQLDESSWQAHMDTCSIKQTYLLCEMCRIPLPIGDDLPGPGLMRDWPRSCYSYPGNTEDRRGRLGSALQDRITEYVKWRNSRSCDDWPWMVCKDTKREGYAGFHLLWDHAKEALFMYSLDRSMGWPVGCPQEPTEYERKHYWADSSDEEDGV